jgi:exodeoxyribonuclease V beta subunit
MTAAAHQPFNNTEWPLPVGTVVDASAGTGKTYAVASHVTLALAMNENLSIGQILITTFTRNAAAELRDRVRRRLVATAAILRGAAADRLDELDQFLLDGGAGDLKAVAARLERAAAEFDTATIATIHGVCTKVLACAGVATDTDGREDVRTRVIAEVVNDELVKESVAGRQWDETRITTLVDAAAGDPFMQPWIEPGIDEAARDSDLLVAHLVERCVGRVHDAMRSQPGFDDLLRLSWDVVSGVGGATVVAQLRERFALAIVDEAQDNAPLQWKFFGALFPGTDGRRLITVGDPKQAIYGFRGADVGAYVDFTSTAERRTLPVNRRSDRPLIEALNAIMDGATFYGETVAYEPVGADAGNVESRIVGSAPLELLDLGEANEQTAVVFPTVRKIIELLAPTTSALKTDSGTRSVTPGDICVIVRANWVGTKIAAELANLRIRAVTAGTASVMRGRMAGHMRALLEAMERPSNPGRIRRAAVTQFFGDHSLRDAGTLAEEAIRPVQEMVARLAAIVRHRGIAAAAAEIAASPAIMTCITAGPEGERQLADFSHIVELLHEHGPGRGCRPDELLSTFVRLLALRDDQEVVSRRVESDDNAVKIMTVHAAKGLEFPCVIVADLWKAASTHDSPGVFHDDGLRVLDVAYARAITSETAAREVSRLYREEVKRLLYVALTRAKHHLTVVTATTSDESVLPDVLRNAGVVPARSVASLPPLPAARVSAVARGADGADVAPLPAGGVRQTYRRTSFSGITAHQAKRTLNDFGPPGSGYDEPAVAATDASAGEREAIHVPAGVGAFALPDLPAGTTFGSVVHEIFERIDTSRPLAEEVPAVVAATATSKMFDGRHDVLAETIVRAMQTPFGGPLGTTCFADIAPADRLAEMDFEMALAGVDSGVMASDVGRVLDRLLPADDPLRSYVDELSDASFDIPLAGLINGSIDAVVRMPGSTRESPRLVIADYKTNKLHSADMARPEEAYAPHQLVAAMAEHHYPLQAVVYGTAVYRMLRWRLRQADPADCLAGIVYAFVRGTRGADAPADAAGRRHGMFVWQPPRDLWPRLSRLFAGDRP